MGPMKFKNQLILRFNNLDKTQTMFTEECLRKMIKQLPIKIKITERFTARTIGMANNIKFKEGGIYCDLDIDINKSNKKDLYPCVKILLSEPERINSNNGNAVIEQGALVSIGMCPNNVDDKILPIKLIKEEK